MNALKLVLGWLFLAGLTAAGTYYAMDEVDQRVGLARFQLHERLGITRYAAASQLPAQPPVQPPAYQPSVQPSVQPPAYQPPVSPPVQPSVQPPSYQPPVSPPVQPSANDPRRSPVNPPTQLPNRPTVPSGTQTPSSSSFQPPSSVQPSVQPPSSTTPPPSAPPPARQPVYTPAQQPVSRPSDFNETNERLIEVRSRVEATQKTWQTRRPAYGTLRPEIQTALSAMRRYVQAAEQALGAGDTAAARRNMDLAEKQLEILKEFE